jgi:uncharacterized membrane protein
MDNGEVLDRIARLERLIAELTVRVWELEGHPAEKPRVAPSPAPAPPPPALKAAVESRIPEPQVSEAPAPPAKAGVYSAEPRVVAPPPPPFAPAPPAPSTDWETVLGGNWLNKIGAFILVVGIALALGYSFSHMGPAGRDAVGIAAGCAMLGAGVVYERRERYRSFARGLIGGGWASLYFTVYAMHALSAARVIESPWIGAALLSAVAVAMIAHALRYRSEAVIGVAYLSAFAALAITEVTGISVIALVPLAASLLYLARRFHWPRLALFALAATCVTCVSRGDSGAPLWTAQALFTVYWLLFEGFEILDASVWLMPWNALGFLSLSLMKWQASDPAHVWAFLAAAAAAYAIGGALRARRHPSAKATSGSWHGPATLTAALAAAAIFLRLHWQWVPFALLVEGELFYLAGVRLRAAYLSLLALPVFALCAVHLWVVEASGLPASAWTPLACLAVAVFYTNRAICREHFYGYAGAAVATLAAGYATPAHQAGGAWFALALVPFVLGWRWRLPDFRYQGYGLALIGALGTIFTAPHQHASTAVGAAVSYALALIALRSNEDRFLPGERLALFDAASIAGAAGLALTLHNLLPGSAVGPAWAAEAMFLAWAAAWGQPFRAAAGLLPGAFQTSAAPGAEATRQPQSPGPASCINRRILFWQSAAMAIAAFAYVWIVNLNAREALPAAAAIACLYGAQLLCPVQSRWRIFHSLAATGLLAIALYYEISGSVLTVAWGIEGLALLGAGFPLRDRTLRLSGLALLLACILKLFVYDLSFLDTLPRIFSFIALGLILVGVSWIYTRFRERVRKYL